MKKNLLMSFLVLLSIVFNATAQERKVTGKVTASEDGSGLPGVSIQLKGTNKGVQTDASGAYSIAVPEGGGKLIYSFIGFNSQEIISGNKSQIDVALTTDTKILSEVVVTGTGSAISKKDLAFDVQAISSKNLPNVPSNSIDQALIGKIAGAQISSTGGMPGQAVNIVLRGINTLNRGTNPMILIDGVQMGATDLNSIDMTMIDRVEVIQGAAAGTVYGAQGANGVIQLFTKKGKNGKINIDVSSGYTSSSYLNLGNVRKADMHGFVTNANNEVIGGSGKPLTLDPDLGSFAENLSFASTNPATLINKPYDKNLKYYDHFKEFFVTAPSTNNSVAITGGNDKGDYGIALSHTTQQSNFKNFGGLSRTNFTANLGFELAKGLKLRSTSQFIYTNNGIAQTPGEYDGGQPAGRGIIYTIFNSRPFTDYEFKTADGNYPAYFGDAAGVNGSNPNYWLQYSKTKLIKNELIQSFNLNYKFTKFVELDAKYGLNYRDENGKFTFLNQSGNVNSNDQQYWVSGFNGTDNTGEISDFNRKTTFQNFLTQAFLKTDFQNDFNINLPLRTTTQVGFDYRNTNKVYYGSYGSQLPASEPFNASQAIVQKVFLDFKEPFVTYGYLVNQRFDYADIAGISGGFRTDYSSAFGAGSKPFTFPRGDAFLRISAFDFWKNSLGKTVDEFKIRAAYGEAGIQPKPFDRYVTLAPQTIGDGGSFYLPIGQPNPNLNVEVSKELEIGTDIGLGLSKGTWLPNATFSASYWKRSTDNAIWDIDSAPSSGIGTIKDNAFSLASHGIQASLNLAMLKSTNVNWNLTTNYSKGTSEITAVKGGGQVVLLSAAGSTGYVLKAGDKVGQLFGFYGIHSLDALAPDGTPALPEASRSAYEVASNGWVVNKTSKAPYFTEKQYAFGDPNPKFFMSFINDISFKNFINVGFQVDWVAGAHVYNQTKEWMYRDGIHSDYQKPFSIGGVEGAWSAFYRGVYAERSRNGTKSYFYEDASFVRLRNVNVTFDVAKIAKIKAFRHLKLNLTGRNLFTKTKYTGFDPEISSGSSNSAWDRGIDHNTMPNLKQYQVSLNLGF
jgi:TonB-dependent starch-binding outer membrane protein SusC